MNYRNLIKGVVKCGLALTLAVSIIGLWKSQTTRATLYENTEFSARLRDGVGREVQIATTNSDVEITGSVDSLSRFINNRSGLQLSDNTKNVLFQMEKKALANPNSRITSSDLVKILTDLTVAKLARISDQQIAEISETMAGFNHPDLPQQLKDNRLVRFRGHSISDLTPAEFSVELKALAREISNPFYRALISEFINTELERKLSTTGNAGIKTSSPARQLSPVQAFLMTYAIISDDLLTDSQDTVNRKLWRQHQALSQIYGSYPTPQSSRPYGKNGYVTSMPLDILDEATQLSLLNAIARRAQ